MKKNNWRSRRKINKSNSRSIERIKNYSDYDYEKQLLLSKEREIFRDIYKDRLNQIKRASNDVDFRDLRYKVMSSGDEYQFDGIEGPIALLNNI